MAGFSCRIVRGEDNFVYGVMAPNGNDSVLYNDALEYLKDPSLALAFAGVTEAPSFSEFYRDGFGRLDVPLDVNGEPTFNAVLNFVKSQQEVREFDSNDILELVDFATSSGRSFDDFKYLIKQAFYDHKGMFTLDRDKLLNSGLYDNYEIDNMFKNLGNIDELKSYILGIENIEDLNIRDERTIKIVGEFTSFGKVKSVPISRFVEDLFFVSDDYFSVEEVEEAIKRYYEPSISGQLLDNADNFNYIANLLIGNRKAVNYVFEKGELVEVKDKNILTELKEGMYMKKPSISLLNDLQTFSETTTDVLEENYPLIKDMLNDIEIDLVGFNIDVVGLSSRLSAENINDVIELISSANRLLTGMYYGSVNDSLLEDFSNAYNKYFEVPSAYTLASSDVAPGRAILNIENIDAKQAFEKGYMKLNGNLHTTIDTSVTYNDLIETIVNSYENGQNLLQNIIDDNELSTDEFRTAVDNYVNRIVTDNFLPENRDIAPRIVIEKITNNLPIVKEERYTRQDVLTNKNLYDLMSVGRFEEFSNNKVPIIVNNMIKEKLEGSLLYENLFSGIIVKNDGIVYLKPSAKQALNQILSISNESSELLRNMFMEESMLEADELNTSEYLEAERDFLSDNIEVLPDFSENKSVRVIDNNLITNEYNDTFIRHGNTLFQLINSDKGINVYGVAKRGENSVEISDRVEAIKSEEVKSKNIVSDKKLSEINEELDNCK